jgi:hypothetical protein
MDAEQVAINDARYREANERIEAAAEEYGVGGPVPFICECADPRCTAVVLLTLREYEQIRAHPARFLHLPGHEQVEREHLEVVRREDRYFVVEKRGRAAEIAAELDPR